MIVLEYTGIEACIQSRPYAHHIPEGEGVLTLPYLIPLQFASSFLSALLSQVRDDGDNIGRQPILTRERFATCDASIKYLITTPPFSLNSSTTTPSLHLPPPASRSRSNPTRCIDSISPAFNSHHVETNVDFRQNVAWATRNFSPPPLPRLLYATADQGTQ